MSPFNLYVTFELTADNRAKAFVNDIHVGTVRVMTIKNRDRLVFRCSDNPFKNFVRVDEYFPLNRPISEILEDRHVKIQLVPIVIRNYLHNYASLTEEPLSIAA